MPAYVHCFRCDDVVEADTVDDGPLWCTRCDDEVLGPPSPTGDRSVRWSADGGILLAGEVDERPLPPRRRSVGAQMLGNAMTGLFEVLYGPKDDTPVIEVQDDEPDDDEDIEVHLDEDEPSASWAKIKRPPEG